MQLPFLGQVTIGEKPPVKETKQKSLEVGGGFLDFGNRALSNEKEISDRLIKSFDEWVYINVSTLAEVVSVMEFELLQFKMTGGQIELEPIEEHELLDLLNKFNANTTKSDAIYNTEAHLDLAGDSFWLLDEVNKGKPQSIRLLQPDNITLDLQVDQTKGVLVRAYKYKVVIEGKTIERPYRPEEIIHIKVPNPGNPYRGKSAVEALATTIDTDNYAQIALKQLFKNGMIGDFFLSTEKRATPDQLKNLAAQFKAAYTGVKNFWKVPILYGGIKPEKLMSTGREMQLIELETAMRNKIMSAFKNTRSSLGIDDEVNRSTSESSLLNWKRSVIAPKMARIVNALNEYLVPRYGDNLILGFKDPVPEDRDSEIKEATDLFNAKIITKNEARQLVGYEEVEGGDEFEVTVNPLAADFGKQVKAKVPALKYVNFNAVLRKANVFSKAKEFKRLTAEARPFAKQLIKNRHKDTPIEEPREHGKFTNQQVWDYHEQKINMVGSTEDVFKSVLENYIDDQLAFMLGNIDSELNKSVKSKALISEYDIEAQLIRAQADFGPLLASIGISSGSQALKLIGSGDIFIAGDDLQSFIKKQIRMFAKSMIETEQETLTGIIADGLKRGLSVPKIENNIRAAFPDIKRIQSRRITRTEVLKTSNHASVVAWQESGLVVAKQWLTARDDRVDPLCAELNGKIINLDRKFFKRGDTFESGGRSITLDYASVPEPPLHVNCRCDVLPILIGQEDFDIRSYEDFQALKGQKAELEAKVDKRTKEYKEAKKLYEDSQKDLAETKEYVKGLEKIAGIGDEK